MKAIVDYMIRITDVPAALSQRIAADLILKNPAWQTLRAIGLPLWGCPKEIILFSIDDNTYMLPRGYLMRLYSACRELGIETEWDNQMLTLPEIEFNSRINLRDYQAPAVHEAIKQRQGVVIAPCGSGKTQMALELIARIQQPALWITHTKDLLNQSMNRAIDTLGLSGNQIGIIQAENHNVGTHITFATVQTLAKRDLSDIVNRFGCIVVDEAHLVYKNSDTRWCPVCREKVTEYGSCKTCGAVLVSKGRIFEMVISQFPARYRYGITASEYRSDGLIETMFHVIGPKIHEVRQDDLDQNVVIPKVYFIETSFTYEQPCDSDEKANLNCKQMVKAMAEDPDRMALIIDTMYSVDDNDCALVLAESLEILRTLKNAMSHRCEFIHGGTPKGQREKILTDMRNGEYTFLFATYQLAKLGLDIPRLNKIFLATPMKDKTSIQQAVGRAMRPFDGKGTPVVYDFYDVCIRQMTFWARERVRVYQSLRCIITGGPKVRKVSA